MGELTDYQLTTDVPTDENNFTEFNVFPNPARDHININIENKGELILYNLNGQTVLTQTLTAKSLTKIDVSLLPNGMYLGVINSDSGNNSFKLIIQK